MTGHGGAHDANLPSGVLSSASRGVAGAGSPGGLASCDRDSQVMGVDAQHGERGGDMDLQGERPNEGSGPEPRARDLEERVTELEQRVVTLAAAVDAASRMRVATPFRINEDIRIAGGRLVRRILEKGSLVADYRGAGRTE